MLYTKNMMKYKAYAKINIGLDVTGVREDGYHLLDTVMQQTGLYDELEFEKKDSGGLRIICSDPDVPTDERNLVYKAVKALMPSLPDLEINLKKNIPSQAGLGGGSSDCAAALKAVNEMYKLGYTDDRLLLKAVKLGADVPFCLTGGTVRCRGIGEEMEVLPPLPMCHILIVKPRGGVSTKTVYEELDRRDYEHPDMESIVSGIKEGNLEKICENLGNVLETVTGEYVTQVRTIRKRLLSLGAAGTLMSGSGTSVYGIFDSETGAARAYEKLMKDQSGKDPEERYRIVLTKPEGRK